MSDRKSKSLEEIDIFRDDKKRRNYFIAGVSLVVAICLVALVVIVMRRSPQAELDAGESSAAEATLETEPTIIADTSIAFTVCEDEAVTSLAQDYFDARLSADAETIYALFGRGDTGDDSAFQNRLKTQAEWIQGFNDITVYTVPGTTDDELLCLVTYTIDFRRTDALAPGVMYFFAQKNDDGGYIIEETLSRGKVDYANAFLEAESASAIIDATDSTLSANLANDSTLALIYTSFVNGDIYSEADLEAQREPEVDIVFDAADSVLVGESALADMSEEASEAASREAAENAADSLAAESAAESSLESTIESGSESGLEESSPTANAESSFSAVEETPTAAIEEGSAD